MRKLVLFIFVSLVGLTTKADPFQDGIRYGGYGLLIGAFAGGTAMTLSEDPSTNLNPVARGASLGLYAGLLVAAIKTMDSEPPGDSRYNVVPVAFGSSAQPGAGFLLSAWF